MRATVRKFEEWRSNFKEKCYLLLWSSWKWCNTHAHQVSPPCVLQLESLRSEEVVLPEAFSNNMRSSWKHVIMMDLKLLLHSSNLLLDKAINTCCAQEGVKKTSRDDKHPTRAYKRPNPPELTAAHMEIKHGMHIISMTTTGIFLY